MSGTCSFGSFVLCILDKIMLIVLTGVQCMVKLVAAIRI